MAPWADRGGNPLVLPRPIAMNPMPRMPRRTAGALLTGVLLASGALAGCRDSPETADGDLPLVGTIWTVEAYDFGDGKTQVPDDVVATVLLHPDDTAVLDTGCNTADARFDAGSGTISFVLMGWTEVGCEGDALELEEALRDFYTHDQLKWAVADDLLVLEPPESVSPDWVDLRGQTAQRTG